MTKAGNLIRAGLYASTAAATLLAGVLTAPYDHCARILAVVLLMLRAYIDQSPAEAEQALRAAKSLETKEIPPK